MSRRNEINLRDASAARQHQHFNIFGPSHIRDRGAYTFFMRRWIERGETRSLVEGGGWEGESGLVRPVQRSVQGRVAGSPREIKYYNRTHAISVRYRRPIGNKM